MTPTMKTMKMPATEPRAGTLPVRQRIARYALWLAALGAGVSAVSSASTLWQAGSATIVVETWRAYGYLVFAGLFALLALRPHRYRGVWELVIANKIALTATALGYAVHGGIAGSGTIIVWDGGLSVVLIVAYILCRGWSGVPPVTGAA